MKSYLNRENVNKPNTNFAPKIREILFAIFSLFKNDSSLVPLPIQRGDLRESRTRAISNGIIWSKDNYKIRGR